MSDPSNNPIAVKPEAAVLVALGLPLDKAGELAEAGATPEALANMTAAELVSEVPALTSWAARSVIAKAKEAMAARAAKLVESSAAPLVQPSLSVDLGPLAGTLASVLPADYTRMTFEQLWGFYLREPENSVIREHVVRVLGGADRRRLVMRNGQVDAQATERFLRSLVGRSFNPGPGFLFSAERLPVRTLDEALKQRTWYTYQGEELLFTEGKLLDAQGVDWSPIYPVPGNERPCKGRAAWLVLATLPEVQAVYGSELIPQGMTRKGIIRGLINCKGEEYDDFGELHSAVNFFQETDPALLALCSTWLELPPGARCRAAGLPVNGAQATFRRG